MNNKIRTLETGKILTITIMIVIAIIIVIYKILWAQCKIANRVMIAGWSPAVSFATFWYFFHSVKFKCGGIHSVPLSAWGSRGWTSNQIFKKWGGGLGKEGVVFSNKNKLKSEISNHKKSL